VRSAYMRVVPFLILILAAACKPAEPLQFGRTPSRLWMPAGIKEALCQPGVCDCKTLNECAPVGYKGDCFDGEQCHKWKWPASTDEGDYLRDLVEQQEQLGAISGSQ
jgi:hypothetical protein